MINIRNFSILTSLLLAMSGCNNKVELTNYDDCILANINGVSNLQAVSEIKKSCLGKFPPNFNWDELARQSGVKPWSVLVVTPEYLKWSDDEIRAFRKKFWEEAIEPNIRPEFREYAYSKFMSHTRQLHASLKQ